MSKLRMDPVLSIPTRCPSDLLDFDIVTIAVGLLTELECPELLLVEVQ